MLGSCKKCSNCLGSNFRKLDANRAIQCASCFTILEERCASDLTEYHITTQTEEVHCCVSPDFLLSHLVDDIPNDPYCTPGFITAFRMLSPIREPVYAATARTISGALSEMERVVGDSIFSGYIGYNGRAPGSASVKKEEDAADRNKSGGEARYTVVAYFEIIELASLLDCDRETCNLAIRIFRHTASNTNMRNKPVEPLAAASFYVANEKRCHEYEQWLKTHQKTGLNKDDSASPSSEDKKGLASMEWPIIPKRPTIQEVAHATNLELSQVMRNVKAVNEALRKKRPENSASVTTHMPVFCKKLDLGSQTRRLAISVAKRAIQKKISSRRNPVSVSAAAIYLACQLDGVRKTQAEICRVTTLTEVTLRKVFKELTHRQDELVPEWFHKPAEKQTASASTETHHGIPKPQPNSPRSAQPDITLGSADMPDRTSEAMKGSETEADRNDFGGREMDLPPPPPLPPPFPPGFEVQEDEDREENETRTPNKQKEPRSKAKEPSTQHSKPESMPPPPPPPPIPSQPGLPTQDIANAWSLMPQQFPMGALSSTAVPKQLREMLANPAVKQFMSALMMMPPMPPPLPKASEADQPAEGKNKNSIGDPAKPRQSEKAKEKEKEIPPMPENQTKGASASSSQLRNSKAPDAPPGASLPTGASAAGAVRNTDGIQETAASDGATKDPTAVMATMVSQLSHLTRADSSNAGHSGRNFQGPGVAVEASTSASPPTDARPTVGVVNAKTREATVTASKNLSTMNASEKSGS